MALATHLLVLTVVSLPREILPGRFQMLTRRCTQRLFLLRPDDETNNTVLYCLAEAAQRFQIDVILPSVMSNHHHLTLFDRHGRICEFTEHFHRHVARAMNALRGRWENFWASEPPCYVQLVEVEDVLDKVVYAATNPVKDGLVERVSDWPGVNGTSALLEQRTIVAHRPKHFFRDDGPMPETVTLELVIPPELGDPDAFRQAVRERVAAVERTAADERRRTGRRVLGRRAILRQAFNARPSTREPRRGLRPRIAARNKWARIEALQRNRDFLTAYRHAWERWRQGMPAVFPAGTYHLRRLVDVLVVAAA